MPVLFVSLRCNYIESLLGIETAKSIAPISWVGRLQLYWIPIRDWNKRDIWKKNPYSRGCNYIESLLGIETL